MLKKLEILHHMRRLVRDDNSQSRSLNLWWGNLSGVLEGRLSKQSSWV